MRRLVSALVMCACLAAPQLARAQAATDPGFKVNYGIDGAITGGELGLSLLASLIHVNRSARWNTEIFGSVDLRVRSNFSASADALSNLSFGLAVVTPLFAELGSGINDEAGRRTLLYGETIGASLLFNAIAKYTVQRPRPYAYSGNERVKAYIGTQGNDSRVSFYSGHAALTFAAAVSGSYLFAEGSSDKNARAVMWGVEFALASATANLRVIAGKHYYSDVVIGAIMGAAIGFGVPALHHSDRGVLEPTGREWAAMGGGLLVGILATELIPFKQDIIVPLTDSPPAKPGLGKIHMTVAPMAAATGGGLMVLGTF